MNVLPVGFFQKNTDYQTSRIIVDGTFGEDTASMIPLAI